MIILLSLALLIAGLVLLWFANRQHRALGLPAGRIIYSDTQTWNAVDKALYDPAWNLTGKPDYLILQSGGEQIIPVEVKTSRISAMMPYDSHIYQVAAYCHLVESTYGVRPAYGVIHYSNTPGKSGGRTFAIDYTPELRASLRALLDDMHAAERHRDVKRSHSQPNRCKQCGYRDTCDQVLK